MGSCVSVHKDHPESAMKLRLSVGPKDEKLLIPSPVKEKPRTVNGGNLTIADLAIKSQWLPDRSREAGSKDEAFFDSQPWLDSDCEDDFLSVNGDFTPSRGSTPVHHKFSSGNQQLNKAHVVEGTLYSVPEPSPPDKKKRLSELFKESLSSHEGVDDENDENMVSEKAKTEATILGRSKSTNGTPRIFGATEKKSVKSVQCCLPRLLPSRSFSERKKKMSPVQSIG